MWDRKREKAVTDLRRQDQNGAKDVPCLKSDDKSVNKLTASQNFVS